MKKIVVTGCNGQLGRAINRAYNGSEEFELINTDVEELDITCVEEVISFVDQIKPYAIINCAAYTAVDKCETDGDSAYKINAIGPRNLAIAAKRNHAKIMHVSTDYVFAGDGTKPYTEFDLTNPQSMYGTTKLAGENFVKEFAEDYFIIRTAWLYGEGKNFVKTMLGLSENHDTIRVVNDQFGSPTSATELAKAIKYLVPTNNFGVFHGTCEGMCSWADFTKEIFRLTNKKTVVEAISTEEYNSPAKRPAYSVLENYMLKLTTEFMFADWKTAIQEYVRDFIE